MVENDAVAVILQLGAVLQCREILFGFELIQNQPCPRWHADHVTVRSLLTYFGSGTQVVENAFVDRCVFT